MPKLIATVSESRDRCLQGLLPDKPDAEEIAWTIICAAEIPENLALSELLGHLISGAKWEDAKDSFTPHVLSLLPPLEAVLRNDPHWVANEGSVQFVNLLHSILTKDLEVRSPSESYSLLLVLLHGGSPDRATSLNQIHLNLSDRS